MAGGVDGCRVAGMVKLGVKDPFEATVVSYCDPKGAEAYVLKEMPVHSERTAAAFRLVEGVALEGLRVLDVGCGFGRDVGEFRRRGAEAFGVDVSEALLGRAREQYGPYFRVDNVRGKGAFAWEGPFDLVWCCAVLVHVPRTEMEGVLRRMWEALKPGGRLAIWTKVGEGERVMANLGKRYPRVMVYYTPDEILGPLKAWGAVVERVTGEDIALLPTGDGLFYVRVRKPIK